MAINFPQNPQINDVYTSGTTTWQWNGSVWNVVAASSSISVPNGFGKVAVAGQNTVNSNTSNDTLNLIAGSNITISTSDISDSITINSSGGGEVAEQNLWATISADSGATTANTTTDTLTIAGGTGISTAISGDTLTVSFTGSSINNITDLNDVSTSGATIDEMYLPAITMLEVTNAGASAYRFDQYGSSNNPTIYAINGTTIAFKLNVEGHPFLIQNSTGVNFSTGLIHVATDGTVSSGTNAQGKTSGTLYWKVPSSISSPPNYRYQCSVHAAMVGGITIKNFAAI